MTNAKNIPAAKKYEEAVSTLIDTLRQQLTAAAQGTDMRDMETWYARWAQVEEGVKTSSKHAMATKTTCEKTTTDSNWLKGSRRHLSLTDLHSDNQNRPALKAPEGFEAPNAKASGERHA